MLCAKIGILDDPNPVIFGIMAFLTFWPSLILIFIGIIKQLSLKLKSSNTKPKAYPSSVSSNYEDKL